MLRNSLTPSRPLAAKTMACPISACLTAPVARRAALASARGLSGRARCISHRVHRPILARACSRQSDVHRSSRATHVSTIAPRRGLAAAPLPATRATQGDSNSDTKPLYQAVVVVAGGIEDDGTLPAWVTSRLDFAAEEYSRHAENSTAKPPTYIVLSGSATPHKPPPVAKGGFVLHESTAMAEYLLKNGVPADSILKDTASMDTIGNAYFSLTMHAIPREWKNVLVVTSKFHMGRTRAAFEWVWNLYTPEDETPFIDMDFVSTPDDGLSDDVVVARLEREAKSEAALRANQQRINNMPDFAEWLYTTHMCYSVGRQHEIGEFEEMKNDPALKSY